MSKHIGILTSGGDCPGLNPAIRAVGKAAIDRYGMELVGFRDGFRGLVLDRTMPLESKMLSGILTDGGTILGTSRDKPHKMPMGDKVVDMTDVIVQNYRKHHLDALICLGGGGTQKNAFRLHKLGLNIVTLPKTIDNDVPFTDMTFGFDTAMQIATEAIDRLHSTATSHHRIIVVELMGHRAGWLALGAGLAGGADVILIPEIPYSLDVVAEAIRRRTRAGKRFSIVAVAEGAMTVDMARQVEQLVHEKDKAEKKSDRKRASEKLDAIHEAHVNHTLKLTHELEARTGQESRLSILGHLQRGGTPSATDRVLATKLGAACARFLSQGQYGIMVASRGDDVEAVPLEKVAGHKKLVPADHEWIHAARSLETCLGDA